MRKVTALSNQSDISAVPRVGTALVKMLREFLCIDSGNYLPAWAGKLQMAARAWNVLLCYQCFSKKKFNFSHSFRSLAIICGWQGPSEGRKYFHWTSKYILKNPSFVVLKISRTYTNRVLLGYLVRFWSDVGQYLVKFYYVVRMNRSANEYPLKKRDPEFGMNLF